jgi:opacity protein-like surface antigen
LAGVAAAVAVAASPIRAQDGGTQRIVPTNNTVISGYGTVGYAYRTQGDNENEYTASINPIFLFQFQDRILFEAEWEFELEEGVTETGLEYAQLDWIVSDNLVLVGGKYLIPFGVFGERIHPSWINKLTTAPPIYGHHVTEFGRPPLLPVLTDVGLMARGVVRPGRFEIGLNAYVTNGPAVEEGATELIPELEFPASSGDNNTNKMVGGRLDLVLPPWAELNFSIMNGDYDDNNVLDFTAWNVAAELRRSGFEFRGEYIQTRQEIETVNGFPTVRRHGFFSQLAYRWREWEPVVRWTQIFDDKLDGATIEEGAWQVALGLDYWFSPSIAVMVAYEVNREDGIEIDNDRVVAHVAFGF